MIAPSNKHFRKAWLADPSGIPLATESGWNTVLPQSQHVTETFVDICSTFLMNESLIFLTRSWQLLIHHWLQNLVVFLQSVYLESMDFINVPMLYLPFWFHVTFQESFQKSTRVQLPVQVAAWVRSEPITDHIILKWLLKCYMKSKKHIWNSNLTI